MGHPRAGGRPVESIRAGQTRSRAAELGVPLYLQDVPPCLVGDPGASQMDRIRFGITHYLHETDGRTVYAVAWTEAQVRGYLEMCTDCTALDTCCGVEHLYLERHGLDVPGPCQS